MSTKVVVTNVAALKRKYGASGYARVKKGLDALAKSDVARGFATRIVDISSPSGMKKVGGRPVVDAQDQRGTKAAIDAVAGKFTPDYLLLLGAPDVIPHVDLDNPADEDDRTVPSDLPYACEAAFSTKITSFLGPTRVVGRLPDLVGASQPEDLLVLLDVATKWTPEAAKDDEPAFAISAAVWKGSTALSLRKLVGHSGRLLLSPPAGPSFTKAELAPRWHFVNCHGSPADPQFYGQEGAQYPVAMTAAKLDGRLRPGTVASVECCYGAELYDPALAGGEAGIASIYLRNRAAGYFGSTTIAYGPADGNGAADLICQGFLKKVMAGASLGRAALEARQEFAGGVAELDPVDLKTLGQFILLGDPSLHVIAKPTPHRVPGAKRRSAVASTEDLAAARSMRRRSLLVRGRGLAATQCYAEACPVPPKASRLHLALDRIAKEAKLRNPTKHSFTIVVPRAADRLLRSVPKRLPAPSFAPAAFHLLVQRTVTKDKARHHTTIVVAREESGTIVSYRRLESR